MSAPPRRPATAALSYESDGFSVDRADVMGRHSAGAGLLGGLARHHDAEALYCFSGTRAEAVDYAGRIREACGRSRPVVWLSNAERSRLGEAGCLFTSNPGIAELAWQRRMVDQRLYSVCGLTHTICSGRALDAIAAASTAPVQPWDALIVTSHAAKRSIELLLDQWADYLEQRIGARPTNDFQMPVIPLGVDCSRFERTSANDSSGKALRARLAIPEDEVALLFLGRLSFHAKAHPMPLFLACERACQELGRPLHLLMCGRFANEHIESDFRQAASRHAPSVRVVFVDGTDREATDAVWFASDIFVSLSDNIQETFGLTPVEAMAAGMPVIVSDWDGYRDTVPDGEVGFRIPTAIPPVGAGEALVNRFMVSRDAFDRYIGSVSLATSVNVPATTAAIVRLAENPDERKAMGARGRARALERYDWSVVIAAYEALWADLAERRASAPERTPRRPGDQINPLRADPFLLFGGFATNRLGAESHVILRSTDPSGDIDRQLALGMNNYVADTLLARDELVRLTELLAGGPRSVADLAARASQSQRAKLERSLLWMAKMDILWLTFP